MSSLSDRLRAVVGSGKAGLKTRDYVRPNDEESSYVDADLQVRRGDAADVLGGEWRERGAHRYLVIERKYSPGHRHGHVAVCDAAPEKGIWRTLPLLLTRGPAEAGPYVETDRYRALFIDLETTGLAGGAGTYAFLVGCGWFDGAVFRLRQYFLSSFAAERAMLEEVAELAADAAVIVTYNGKSFDLPLLENRFALHRRTPPFAGVPHVDMLHPARRLWRSGEEGCRLVELEQTLFAHEREGDVPGFEIPARYFAYVRSSDARPLAPVMEHNRQDIVSLAMLTARASQLLEDGPTAARNAREALGMGRLFERARRLKEASQCFWQGAQLPGDADTLAESLRGYAILARRDRRYADAADAWRRLLALPECPASLRREATEALAVHHEHRARDLAAAREFAIQSLHLQAAGTRRQAVEHRLARIDRKMAIRSMPALF